jgi:hypothetical protein
MSYGHVEIVGGHPPGPGEVDRILREERVHAVDQAMGVIVGEVRASVPKVTGETARRVSHTIMVIGNKVIGQFVPGSAVLEWLEEGTGIYGPAHHLIQPRSAQALRFPNRRGSGVRGPWAFAKFVRGIRPRRYVENAYEKTDARRQTALQHGADRAAARIEQIGVGR